MFVLTLSIALAEKIKQTKTKKKRVLRMIVNLHEYITIFGDAEIVNLFLLKFNNE